MGVQEYLEQMKHIQQDLIKYIDNDDKIEENFQNLKNDFDDIKIHENKHELREFLHLILNISNNHHRNSSFFDKIERILSLFETEIHQNFANYDIFNIFKSNKRILLFLFEKKILIPDSSIATSMTKPKYIKSYYHSYFFNELKPFLSEYMIKKIDEKDKKFAETREFIENNFDSFNEKRKNGENDEKICQLIRNDSIDQFITYVNSNDFPLSSKIEQSIYETNQFLNENEAHLIEYAAFYGSIQIFKYLFINKCQPSPTLWLFAIHGQNPEVIHYLEENKIMPQDETYRECLFESFKCHHIDITDYILNNLYHFDHVDNEDSCLLNLKYFNYNFLPENLSTQTNIFYNCCKYDHFIFADLIVKTTKVDVNSKLVFNIIFFFKYNFNVFFCLMSFMNINYLMEFQYSLFFYQVYFN